MQSLLFTAIALALAVLAYMIYRLIVTARCRAQEIRHPVSGDQDIAIERMDSDNSGEASPSVFVDMRGERPAEALAALAGFSAEDPSTALSIVEEDIPYADPVDGMPFKSGEPVVPCVCGLAYREESIKWLRDYHGGSCIYCGALVGSSENRS